MVAIIVEPLDHTHASRLSNLLELCQVVYSQWTEWRAVVSSLSALQYLKRSIGLWGWADCWNAICWIGIASSTWTYFPRWIYSSSTSLICKVQTPRVICLSGRPPQWDSLSCTLLILLSLHKFWNHFLGVNMLHGRLSHPKLTCSLAYL